MWHVDRFPWHATFTAVPIYFYIFCPTSIYIVKRLCIFTYTDCLEIVYKLLLLPKNTLRETFLHKFRAVQSVVWVLIIGVTAWQWLDEYVHCTKCLTIFFSNRMC